MDAGGLLDWIGFLLCGPENHISEASAVGRFVYFHGESLVGHMIRRAFSLDLPCTSCSEHLIFWTLKVILFCIFAIGFVLNDLMAHLLKFIIIIFSTNQHLAAPNPLHTTSGVLPHFHYWFLHRKTDSFLIIRPQIVLETANDSSVIIIVIFYRNLLVDTSFGSELDDLVRGGRDVEGVGGVDNQWVRLTLLPQLLLLQTLHSIPDTLVPFRHLQRDHVQNLLF